MEGTQETAITCAQCGGTADSGRIVCANCGVALRAPTPLIAPTVQAPTKPQRILWKWSLVVTVLFFGYFMWQCGSGMRAGAGLSDDAVGHFHSQLDSEAYSDILRESDEAFQKSASSDEITKFLAGVH